MQSHLGLLATVDDISPILALRGLFEWEGDFQSQDYAPALCARQADEPQTRAIFVDGSSSPTVTAFFRDSTVQVRLFTDHIPAALATVLAAAGLGRPSDNAARPLIGDIDHEEFWDRALTIDAAWVLLRKLKRQGLDQSEAVAAAMRLLQLAQQAHALRMDIYDHGSTPQREARFSQLEEQAARVADWGIPGLNQLLLRPDPRGSALGLIFTDRSYETELSALSFNWRPGSFHPKRSAAPSRGKFEIVPTRIPNPVLAVVEAAVVDGMQVRIPEKLPKKLYEQVNDLLRALGGSWHTGKQAHVFKRCPAAAISSVLSHGEFAYPRDYEFFRTTTALVERMIGEAGIVPGMRILEPNAGDGAIALAAAAIVGIGNVHVHELMPSNVELLKAAGFVIEDPTDFLSVTAEPVHDVVLMNPPFAKNRDIAHITHALKFVRPGGCLVAMASCHWRTVSSEATDAFRQLMAQLDAKLIDVPAGAFRESGTEVPTTMIVIKRTQPARLATSAKAVAASPSEHLQPQLF